MPRVECKARTAVPHLACAISSAVIPHRNIYICHIYILYTTYVVYYVYVAACPGPRHRHYIHIFYGCFICFQSPVQPLAGSEGHLPAQTNSQNISRRRASRSPRSKKDCETCTGPHATDLQQAGCTAKEKEVEQRLRARTYPPRPPRHVRWPKCASVTALSAVAASMPRKGGVLGEPDQRGHRRLVRVFSPKIIERGLREAGPWFFGGRAALLGL
jgi:hypothetical protein